MQIKNQTLTEDVLSSLINEPLKKLSNGERLHYRRRNRHIAISFIVAGVALFLISVVIAGIWSELGVNNGSRYSRGGDSVYLAFNIAILSAPIYGVYRLVRSERFSQKMARRDHVIAYPQIGYAADAIRQKEFEYDKRKLRPYGIALLVIIIIANLMYLAIALSKF